MSMEIVQQSPTLLLRFGRGWVLWILVAASIASIAVVIERSVALRTLRISGSRLREMLRSALRSGGRAEAIKVLGRVNHPAARVALRGMDADGDTRHAMDAE